MIDHATAAWQFDPNLVNNPELPAHLQSLTRRLRRWSEDPHKAHRFHLLSVLGISHRQLIYAFTNADSMDSVLSPLLDGWGPCVMDWHRQERNIIALTAEVQHLKSQLGEQSQSLNQIANRLSDITIEASSPQWNNSVSVDHERGQFQLESPQVKHQPFPGSMDHLDAYPSFDRSFYYSPPPAIGTMPTTRLTDYKTRQANEAPWSPQRHWQTRFN